MGLNYYKEYAYDYGPTADTAVATILMIYFGFFLIWGIYALVCYIIKGVGLYTIAKRQGEAYPWLAFVPYARTYLHGELSGEIVLKKKSIRNPGIWLIAIPFIEGIAVFVLYIVLFGMIGFSAYATAGYGSAGMGVGMIGMIVFIGVVFALILIVFSAALQVLRVLVNHQILEKFTTKNMSIAHAILMGVIPLYEPICLMIMSRKPYNPGMEPMSERPFMQMPPQGGDPIPPMSPQEGNVMPPQNVNPAAVPECTTPRGLWNPEANASQEPKNDEPKQTEDE